MPRPLDPNKKVPLSVRMEPNLRKRVDDVANTDSRFDSRSDLVGRAVDDYLKRLDASDKRRAAVG